MLKSLVLIVMCLSWGISLYSHVSMASDYPEAVSVVLNELIKPKIDSTQLDVGPSVNVRQLNETPGFHVKSNLYFRKRYNAGISFNANPASEKDFSVYAGINFGVKGFSPQVGSYTLDTLVGYGVKGSLERIVIEPSIVIPLVNSKPANYFWMRHKFGVNAALSYRHAIDKDNLLQFDSTNSIKLYLIFYINQKLINQ